MRGVSIVSAIVLLVIFAMLGAFMMRFSTAQHASMAQDQLGSMAYQAAYAGLERGIHQVRNANNCVPGPFVPGVSGLSVFTVTIQCSSTVHTVGEFSITIWHITSTAVLTGIAADNQGFVERRLEATVEAVPVQL
jgi:MSHA biogenesis protein MshP